MATPTRAARLAACAALCLALPTHAATASSSAAPMPAHFGGDGAGHVTQLGLHVRRELAGTVTHTLDGAEAAELPLRKAAAPLQKPERVLSVDQMGCAWIPIGGGKKKLRGDSPESAP